MLVLFGDDFDIEKESSNWALGNGAELCGVGLHDFIYSLAFSNFTISFSSSKLATSSGHLTLFTCLSLIFKLVERLHVTSLVRLFLSRTGR